MPIQKKNCAAFGWFEGCGGCSELFFPRSRHNAVKKTTGKRKAGVSGGLQGIAGVLNGVLRRKCCVAKIQDSPPRRGPGSTTTRPMHSAAAHAARAAADDLGLFARHGGARSPCRGGGRAPPRAERTQVEQPPRESERLTEKVAWNPELLDPTRGSSSAYRNRRSAWFDRSVDALRRR